MGSRRISIGTEGTGTSCELTEMDDAHNSVPSSSSNGGGSPTVSAPRASTAADTREMAGGEDSGGGAPKSGVNDSGAVQSAPVPPPLTAPAPGNGLPPIDFEKVPSLRGMLFPGEIMGASIKGLWAMIDSDHGQEGRTSEFELHFLQGIGKMTMDPVELLSGKYKGWFRLKRVHGNGTDKIEEKNVVLNFSKKDDGLGDYSIKGEGSNRFGAFLLQGTLGRDNSVIMYRQYVVKVGSTPKGGATAKTVVPKASAGAKKAPSAKSAFKPAAGEHLTGSRDGAVRERKKSAGIDDAYVGGEGAARPKGVKVDYQANPRAQRLSQHLLRCGDLLKEMKKLPASIYFLEPVDPIKLNIPDYLTLITNPMDFRTIASKLSGGEYEGPTNFAEDVRLVFKNAITYNQAPDNPVHMAAREMSVKFEEKFKALSQSVSSKQSVSAAELAAFTSRSNRPAQAAKPKSKSSGGSRKSSGGAVRAGAALLPPDGSMIQMEEMQRKMMEMTNEIMSLRQQVGIQEPLGKPTAAQKALTYNEKKTLIEAINNLPEQYMERIVQIVQEAQPVGAVEDEEVEVPLDELDTATLRKLQAVVDEAHHELHPGAPLKRGADSSSGSSRPQRAPPAKKARTSGSAFGTAPAPTSFPAVPVVSAPPLASAPPAAPGPSVEAPSEDYGEIFAGSAQAVKVEAVAASADAWAMGGGSSGADAASGAATGDSSWDQAGSELQARQEREQQRRQEEERLQQQREKEEQQRAEALRAEAQRQEEQRIREEKEAREAAERQEAELQARREEERRRREETSAVAVDSSDVLKQMESEDI